MVNKRIIFLSFSIVILILGFFISPMIPFVYGIVILYLCWSEAGGLAYGDNLYKKQIIEGKRPIISKTPYSSINASNDQPKPTDYSYLMFLFGLGNLIYAFILFYLMYR